MFGRVKLWGEVVEHEWGYRSQFARIISLDYGDPELLEKFRVIYGIRFSKAHEGLRVTVGDVLRPE